MAEITIDTSILKEISIFSALSDADLAQIMNTLENGITEHGMKETIVKESEIADCMHIVLDRAVGISIRGAGGGLGRDITIATLQEGNFFGDQSLMITGETGYRNTTIRSLHKTKLFKIDKKERLSLRHICRKGRNFYNG